jgi:hypothetical protein
MFRNWDHAFPYDEDMADAFAETDGGNYGQPSDTRCKFCGDTDVYWAQEDGRWVLYGTNSRRHVCEKTGEMTERNVSAFDKLD